MKLKPNKKNITLMFILIISTIIVIKDFKMLIMGYQFTWLGLITNVIMLSIIIVICDHIKEYTTKKELKKRYTHPRK